MRILDILFVVVFIGNSLNKLGGSVSNVYMAVFIRSKSLRLPFYYYHIEGLDIKLFVKRQQNNALYTTGERNQFPTYIETLKEKFQSILVQILEEA